MSSLAVLLDASVLYPAPLRDLLMHVAMLDLCRAKWTDAIHDESIGNVLKNRPDLSLQTLERTRTLMNAHVRDCLVTGYESLIDTITLPDLDDRHVLAAAIHAEASGIITFNLKDFPEDMLKPYGISARSSDDFFASLLDLAPSTFCLAVQRHRASLKNPPKNVDEYLQTLAAQGLHQVVAGLHRLAEFI